jgi:MFS transporter, ACS family, DAL5 transporter family protein
VCSCIFTITAGIYSDKLSARGPFILLGDVVSLIGYILAYVTNTPGAGYVAAIIAASGVYPTIPIILSWAGGNAGGEVKRAVVFAMVVGIGNLGG